MLNRRPLGFISDFWFSLLLSDQGIGTPVALDPSFPWEDSAPASFLLFQADCKCTKDHLYIQQMYIYFLLGEKATSCSTRLYGAIIPRYFSRLNLLATPVFLYDVDRGLETPPPKKNLSVCLKLANKRVWQHQSLVVIM